MFGFLKKPAARQTPSLRREQLQPRIKHVHFINALRQGGVPQEQWPCTTPLCGELLVTYAFDLADGFVMATPSMLREAGVIGDELAELGRANLRRAMPQPQFFAKDGCGLAHTGGELEATLLLLDEVWQRMQPNFAGAILAAVPRRDRILLCDGGDPAATAALARQTGEFFDQQDDAHRLSTQLMRRNGDGWSLFNAH